MFEKNAGAAIIEGAQHDAVSHACGHHQYAPGEAPFFGAIEELGSLLVTEVVIQQDHIDGFQILEIETFGGRGGIANDEKVRFGLEQPAEALAEEAVIVD